MNGFMDICLRQRVWWTGSGFGVDGVEGEA